MDSTEGYIRRLEKTCFVDIPQELRDATEMEWEGISRIRELTAKLSDLLLEINYLKTRNYAATIVDLPLLVWENITSFLSYPDQDLLNLSRASPFLDEVLSMLPKRSKVQLTGSAAFFILAKGGYFKRKKLKKCFHSGDNDVSRFAATSWKHVVSKKVSHKKYKETVCFNKSVEVTKFIKHNSKLTGKSWEKFSKKQFDFCVDESDSPHFWFETHRFLQRFGHYVQRLMIIDESSSKAEIFPTLKQVLGGKFPLLRIAVLQTAFFVFDFKKSPDQRTADWNTTLSYLDEHKNEINANISDGEIWMEIRKRWKDRPKIFGFLRPYLQATVFRKLSITTSCESRLSLTECLRYAVEFPQISELTLRNFAYKTGGIEQAVPFQMVFTNLMKFTSGVGNHFCLLPLSKFPRLFPHLEQLCFTSDFTKVDLSQGFQKALKDVENSGTDPVDVYHLYANGRNLARSNIWRFVKTLRKLEFVTSPEDDGTETYVESFTRQNDGPVLGHLIKSEVEIYQHRRNSVSYWDCSSD